MCFTNHPQSAKHRGYGFNRRRLHRRNSKHTHILRGSLCGEDEDLQDGADGPLRTKARKFKVLLEYGQIPEYIAAEYERAPQLRTPLPFHMPVAVFCKKGNEVPSFFARLVCVGVQPPICPSPRHTQTYLGQQAQRWHHAAEDEQHRRPLHSTPGRRSSDWHRLAPLLPRDRNAAQRALPRRAPRR